MESTNNDANFDLLKKTRAMIGLCQKAMKLVSGEVACEKSLQDGSARLVIVATDASNNTKKKFVNKSFYYKVPCYTMFDKDDLSKIIGKQNRATLVVTDDGFAGRIEEMLKNIGATNNRDGE